MSERDSELSPVNHYDLDKQIKAGRSDVFIIDAIDFVVGPDTTGLRWTWCHRLRGINNLGQKSPQHEAENQFVAKLFAEVERHAAAQSRDSKQLAKALDTLSLAPNNAACREIVVGFRDALARPRQSRVHRSGSMIEKKWSDLLAKRAGYKDDYNAIWNALAGVAKPEKELYSLPGLEKFVDAERTLQRRLKDMKEFGLIKNEAEMGGYYRPDHPPA